jgi:tetratricopeptide (TPR) repeat protein
MMKADPLKQVKLRKKLQAAVEDQFAGRFVSARAIYEEVLAAEPDNADALHGLGVLCVQEGLPEQAETWLKRALQQVEEARIWNDLGEALRLQGKPAEAVEAYEAALKLRPDFTVAMNNCGVSLSALGELERAQRMFDEAVRLEPGSPFAYNNLGVLLEHLGRYEDALRQFEKAVQLKPDFADALDNYSGLMARHPELLAHSLGRLLDQAKGNSAGV